MEGRDERGRQPIKDVLPNQLPQEETELDLPGDSGTQCGRRGRGVVHGQVNHQLEALMCLFV